MQQHRPQPPIITGNRIGEERNGKGTKRQGTGNGEGGKRTRDRQTDYGRGLLCAVWYSRTANLETIVPTLSDRRLPPDQKPSPDSRFRPRYRADESRFIPRQIHRHQRSGLRTCSRLIESIHQTIDNQCQFRTKYFSRSLARLVPSCGCTRRRLRFRIASFWPATREKRQQ